jgi:hypothetical protein
MSDLEFILLMGVLIQNSNTTELAKFLEKNQSLYIQIEVVTLKITSWRAMNKEKLIKSENTRFYEQNKLLF